MGLLIALSGLDGSGKTTQAEHLYEVCKSKGMHVNMLHLKTIESNKYLLKIKKKMHKYVVENHIDDVDEINNIGRAFLFCEKVYDKVLPSINSYDLTILDRYRESALCYHYLGEGLYSSVEKIYDTLVTPDINIFLDLSPKDCYKRITDRDYLYLFETPKYLEKAYAFYQLLREDFTWVDATESIDVVTQSLVSIIEERKRVSDNS